MLYVAVILDWAELALRWTHVVTAIAWIGSSFYFIALDLGLRRNPGLPEGATGEEWQVHGGGFYHIQKYAVAPERMPESLTWFKWESYSTWLSGAALMILVYWVGADLHLIDRERADLEPLAAIAISAAVIGIGWILYNALCKSRLSASPTALMIVLFLALVAMGWGLNQVFTGRAAMLHLGAFTATIMTANVFFVIIPNQRIVVAELVAGRDPDPEFGRIAKLRSTHNNYLTLPVIFLMLSPHYPLTFASEYNWLIAALVFLMGVTIRHYFNARHARTGNPIWTWPVTAALFLAAIWLSTLAPAHAPDVPEASAQDAGASPAPADSERAAGGSLPPVQARLLQSEAFPEAMEIAQIHCAACHSREPVWPGIAVAPKGVYLETETDVARHARQIYLQAALSRAMPPANVTSMTPEERNALVMWFRDAS